MQVGPHNIAYVLLHDMLGFGWPIFTVIVLVGIRTLITRTGGQDRPERMLFIGGGIALFCGVLFLLLDGSQILELSGKKPIWGMTFLLAVILGITGAVSGYSKRRREADQISKGLFEVDAPTQDMVWYRPGIFASAGILLFAIALIWLVILSRGPVF